MLDLARLTAPRSSAGVGRSPSGSGVVRAAPSRNRLRSGPSSSAARSGSSSRRTPWRCCSRRSASSARHSRQPGVRVPGHLVLGDHPHQERQPGVLPRRAHRVLDVDRPAAADRLLRAERVAEQLDHRDDQTATRSGRRTGSGSKSRSASTSQVAPATSAARDAQPAAAPPRRRVTAGSRSGRPARGGW